MSFDCNCDGSGPHVFGEVRLLPLGGGANLILCRNCWQTEIEYRRKRNRELGKFAQFSLPEWTKGEVYSAGGTEA